VIKRNLDGMALVKLNALHLHLTEDQGFRIESKRFPELHTRGSDGKFFTQDEMREIIAYAQARGIRVVPEFDIPGHATSWVVSHPELASLPGPYAIERRWGIFDPVLDPTNEATYSLLDGFLGEMAALFPDAYLHIGGDENNGKQWAANPRIQKFIHEHGLQDNAGLHAYFNRRLSAILTKHGKKMIGWDEIFHPDLPHESVIHSWRGPEALAEAARRGYDGILSNGYYIDLNYSAANHYGTDPLPAATTLTAEQQKHVLGGEATMWAEWVTPENIDSRIWPRTAAIAERLWSPRQINAVDDMYRRLKTVSARLEEAGLRHDANYALMLRRLAGDSATPADIAALRAFVDLIEPVKGYQREEFHSKYVQSTPLTGLADTARPDSAAARDFTNAAERFLFSAPSYDAIAAASLRQTLQNWIAAAERVSTVLPEKSPRLQEATALAAQLTSASRLGLDALDSLLSGKPPADPSAQASLAALKQASVGQAACELAVIPALRLLVSAAALQGERVAAGEKTWKEHVQHLAHPVEAPKAHSETSP
jgi:hexosaminidase